MKKFLLLALVTLFPFAVLAQSKGDSPSNPARLGETVSGIVECGEGYTSHELYDVKITLTEVVRGEEALKRIQQETPAGKEFILARIKFEYFARGVPGLCEHPLEPSQFVAYSASGEDYKAVSFPPPKPELRKNIKS